MAKATYNIIVNPYVPIVTPLYGELVTLVISIKGVRQREILGQSL